MSLALVGGSLSFTKATFKGGESNFRVKTERPILDPLVTIEMNFESNTDLFDLLLLVDAIRRLYTAHSQPHPEFQLFMAYVPYARQDRVCNPGESLSIKVLGDFINRIGFLRVGVVDPHSEVTPAVLNRVVVTPQEVFAPVFSGLHLDASNTIIVAPDAGASKKAHKFAKEGGFAGLIQAEKVRDLETMEILETRVPDLLAGSMDFLIVDDICDGGRTFTELAKVLRPMTTGTISLYTTHGIYSYGTEVFDGLIDKLYTANPVGATGQAAVASGKVVRI